MTTDLEALLARVEGAEGADREIDAAICVALCYGGKNSDGAINVRTDADWPGDLLFEVGDEGCCNPVPELTASLDAALALVERVLPGAWCDIRQEGEDLFVVDLYADDIDITANGKTRALAICASLLRCRVQLASETI